MKTVLGFDVYGTLIDTAGVVAELGALVGAKAGEFSRVWREKQLEYSFRRGLMRRYEGFPVCIRDALDYTCTLLGAGLTQRQKERLLAAYRALPPFDDARECLIALNPEAFAVYAFSNGPAGTVETLLDGAGIRRFFLDIVSVEEVRSFKPDPTVYRRFVERSGAGSPGGAWLVSSNPFDVIGAVSAGMRAAWVRRSADAAFDPWGIEPTITVAGLLGIGDRIAAHERGD